MKTLTRFLLAAFAALSFAGFAHAQCVNTVVTGTITDPNGLAYSYASITAQLQPATATPTCGGGQIGGTNTTFADANGTFSMSLPPNTSITPANTHWVFTVSANAGIPAPVGKGTQTWSTGNVTITGSSQSLTSTLDALATALTVTFGGGSGTPCTTTALSYQFDNSGAFGCDPDFTFTSPHTRTLGASGIFNVAGSLQATGSGVVNATALDSVTVTGSAAAGDCPVAGSSSAGTWQLCATSTGANTLGYRIVGAGGQALTAVSQPIDASVQTGADIGLKISAALAACPTTNTLCQVDATAILTNLTTSTNPFVNVNAIGGTSAIVIVYLPCAPVLTNVTWQINKNDVFLIQCGLHNSNSSIGAGSSFPTASPIIGMGDGTNKVFHSKVINTRIIVAGSQAATNDFAFKGQLLQERAGLQDVLLFGQNSASTTSPLAECLGCSHWTYRDIEVANVGLNDGLLDDGNNAIQLAEGDLYNITCNNTNSSPPTQGLNCVHFQDTGASGSTYYNADVELVHAENFATAANWDSQSDGIAKTVDCTTACTQVVNRNTTGYVVLINVGTQTSGIAQYNDQNSGAALTNTVFNRLGMAVLGPAANILGGTLESTIAKSSAYTLQYTDGEVTITGTPTITIPHALPGTLLSKIPWVITNTGSGTGVLACDSGTINGSATQNLTAGNMAIVKGDGTNCEAIYVGSSGGFSNPMTTIGDMLGGGASGAAARIVGGATGQQIVATNGATPAFASPGLADSANSPVSSASYTIACDTSTALVDRVHTIRFQSGASTPVVPLSSATGCGVGFVTTVIDDGAGSLVFGRTSADTFSVFNGSTNSDSQTSFTLTNGQYATLSVAAAGVWTVRITAGGGSASSITLTAKTATYAPLSTDFVTGGCLHWIEYTLVAEGQTATLPSTAPASGTCMTIHNVAAPYILAILTGGPTTLDGRAFATVGFGLGPGASLEISSDGTNYHTAAGATSAQVIVANLGGELFPAITAGGTSAATAYPFSAANVPFATQFVLKHEQLVTDFNYAIQAGVASCVVDFGIYDTSLNLLTHIGASGQSCVSALNVQTAAVPAIMLPPGVYYAVGCTNTASGTLTFTSLGLTPIMTNMQEKVAHTVGTAASGCTAGVLASTIGAITNNAAVNNIPTFWVNP